MKKNLKKVISIVIAFALSFSSFVAFAAPSFTDVANTANYAEAVSTLAALGIVKGYEEEGGFSFKPNDNITRAEVTTMVVAAINATEQAVGMAGSTKFADVDEASMWASGYINVGVANKFISGFAEDNTFRPKDNVTYAQIVSMLVRALGYAEYAEYLGGWPNGYLALGTSTGICKGVALNADDLVTRGQVAMLINNFLDTPIVETNGFTYTDAGKIVPKIEVQDGKGDLYYKTILTENFGIYILEGAITATGKTNPAMDADKATFQIQKNRVSNNYESITGEAINTVGTNLNVFVGDTDAADFLNTYAVAYIELNDSDEWTIKHFIPSGRNKSVSFEMSLFDEDEYDVFSGSTYVADPYVRFYATANATRSTKYPLNKTLGNVALYVNGTSVPMTAANFNTYVASNRTGDIELIDKYENGSAADGYYDIINVTYFATAKVDTVSTATGKVSFSKATAGVGSSVVLDKDDDSKTFHIYVDGAEVSLGELKKDDILSIAYAVNAGFQNSHFYDVYVSRDTAKGQYASYSTRNETFNIGGADYEFTEGTFASNLGSLTMGDTYTLYLDAFGRIFDFETDVSSAKYAIFDKFTKSSADDYYKATLYLPDGTTKAYEVDTTRVTVDGYTGASLNNYLLTKLYNDTNSNSAIDDAEKTTTNKVGIENRVVEYKINSSSKITSMSFVTGRPGAGTMGSPAAAAYKERSAAIGSIKMGDATNIINAITYLDEDNQTSYLALSELGAFVDEVEYTAFAYGNKFSDGTYPLVIVTAGDGAYTEDTRFAVVVDTPGRGDVNGESIYSIDVIYAGEETTLTTVDDADLEINGYASAVNLAKGDVIVFQGEANRVKQIDVLFKASLAVGDYMADTIANLLVVGNNAGAITIPSDVGSVTVGGTPYSKWTTNWNPTINEQEVQLVAGPIVEKKAGYFAIGKVATGTVDSYTGLYTNIDNDETVADGIFAIDFNDDTKVAVYDYYQSERARLTAGTTGDIIATIVGDVNMIGADENNIAWSGTTPDGADADSDPDFKGVATADSTINFAFAKVVDGEATDVFVIRAK